MIRGVGRAAASGDRSGRDTFARDGTRVTCFSPSGSLDRVKIKTSASSMHLRGRRRHDEIVFQPVLRETTKDVESIPSGISTGKSIPKTLQSIRKHTVVTADPSFARRATPEAGPAIMPRPARQPCAGGVPRYQGAGLWVTRMGYSKQLACLNNGTKFFPGIFLSVGGDRRLQALAPHPTVGCFPLVTRRCGLSSPAISRGDRRSPPVT